MRALVVYESMYGNTRAVAVDIAAGLRATHEVTLVPLTRATPELIAAADLIVAGSPTHLHGMPTVASRRMAAETARKQQNTLLKGETARARSWGALAGETARAAYTSGKQL